MARGASHQREVIRIDADGYGAKNGRAGCGRPRAWLNQLRELAHDMQLSANETVQVPEGFAGNAITVAAAPLGARRDATPTVVRR
jgi:hypothetical protein